MQLYPDGRLLQNHGQTAPQIVHDGLKSGCQVVVNVPSKACDAPGVTEDSQITGQRQGNFV